MGVVEMGISRRPPCVCAGRSPGPGGASCTDGAASWGGWPHSTSAQTRLYQARRIISCKPYLYSTPSAPSCALQPHDLIMLQLQGWHSLSSGLTVIEVSDFLLALSHCSSCQVLCMHTSAHLAGQGSPFATTAPTHLQRMSVNARPGMTAYASESLRPCRWWIKHGDAPPCPCDGESARSALVTFY